jgi:hypothetical protein
LISAVNPETDAKKARTVMIDALLWLDYFWLDHDQNGGGPERKPTMMARFILVGARYPNGSESCKITRQGSIRLVPLGLEQFCSSNPA